MKTRSSSFRLHAGASALTVLLIMLACPVSGHVDSGSALQLLVYDTESAPAPIDGNIAPDGQEDKWRSAYVRSIQFANTDGSIVKDGTILLTSDSAFLYVGLGFNSQSAGNVNYATVYFDQNHDHLLDGTTSVPGEYFVKIQGSGPSTVENGGWFGSSGWQAYSSVSPVGLEATAEKHGTGNPNTWNFEFKIPLQGGSGPAGESFLNASSMAEVGLLIEVNDASDGVLHWEPTGRDPTDASAWGEIVLGFPSPERDLAASITLGHDPIIDGRVSSDPAWQHYTSSARSVQFTNYNGDFISGQVYTKSNASDVYVGLILEDRAAVLGDRLNVFLDYDTGTGGDLDYVLTVASEDGARTNYTGLGAGTYNDTHFESTPDWSPDGTLNGIAAVRRNTTNYEFEFRVPLAGTGAEDLQVPLGARLGMNLEFVDATTGESFWWVVAANSRYQKTRVDAVAYTALGWLRLQTGAPVIQPVYPRDGDEVSGHFPFMIYTTSASGDMGIVSASFSDDLGATWQALERTNESGVWTRTWDTTVLADGSREIRIRAEDSTGLTATVVIQVVVDNTGAGSRERPTVVIQSPDPGVLVSGATAITFTTLAAPSRTVLATDISIDGSDWTPTTSPYAWDTTLGLDGSHIFRLRALQSDSLYGYSEPRLVVVDNTPPDVEALSVVYPDGQGAAKAGDVVLMTALVRDATAGIDTATVLLDSAALDGATQVLVDDGTRGDAVAGDQLFTRAVTVTSTSSGVVTVSVSARDLLGNASATLTADVILDNDDPAHVVTVSSDADVIYKNSDIVKLTTTWDGPGYRLTADYGALDSNHASGAEQVVDNGDGSYTVTYAISFENTVADATSIPVTITAYDVAGNGPISYGGFTVQLDNTAPLFGSVDSAQDNYADGDTVVLTAELDDATYRVWADFSAVDSNYSAGLETVTQMGSTYTVSYTISADALNTTPDGSFAITVFAEDVAGNQSNHSTSIELDNTAEPVTILQPRDGELLTRDVVIDVTSADDTRFVRFQVSPDGGANWYNLDGTQTPTDYTQDDDASDGWTQVWRTADDALPDAVDYRIRVMAYDEQDPTPHLIGQDEVGGGLIVDNTPPTLSIEVLPLPTQNPLQGEVYTREVVVRGTYFDLPDSNRVAEITIHHRNEDGDDVNDSPIGVPAENRAFSRRIRLVDGENEITVTIHDEAGLTASQTANLVYIMPEHVVSIGPDGGVVQSPDGTMLKIPPGALQRYVDISITRVPGEDLLPSSDPRVALLKLAHAFEPAGLVFHKPVEVVLTYADADLDPDQNGTPDWDENDLEGFFWDGARWIRTDPPERDPAANTLAMKVNHLATYDCGVITAGAAPASVYWTQNPFDPVEGTTCVFDLPSGGELSLKVYDMTGHLVRTIVDRERVDGTGSLRWDGLNDFDRFVGSGVYVYVFQFTGDNGEGVKVRKPLGVVK
jgi:hypothetical protein